MTDFLKKHKNFFNILDTIHVQYEIKFEKHILEKGGEFSVNVGFKRKIGYSSTYNNIASSYKKPYAWIKKFEKKWKMHIKDQWSNEINIYNLTKPEIIDNIILLKEYYKEWERLKRNLTNFRKFGPIGPMGSENE